MIVVHLMGGLGNQLFQYAAARSVAIARNTELRYHFEDSYKLAKRVMSIDKFNVTGRLLAKGEGDGYLPLRRIKRRIYSFLGYNVNGKSYYEKQYYRFDKDLFDVDDIYLDGFWQSYRYFETIVPIIRTDLTLKNPSRKFEEARDIVTSNPKATSVHIRRSDYTNLKSNFSSLSVDYYQKAIEKVKSLKGEISLVIFSDDTAWVKDNLDLAADTVFAEDFRLPDHEELMLMSSCSNHIIANSSFSWWGAWLNPDAGKVVIAPRAWHPAHSEESELIPQDWIQL